jgi:hypothetical protein
MIVGKTIAKFEYRNSNTIDNLYKITFTDDSVLEWGYEDCEGHTTLDGKDILENLWSNMASKSSGVISTLIWAILWGIVSYALIGQTTNAFLYGFVLSILSGIAVIVLIVPVLGIAWYISILNWMSTSLSTALTIQPSNIILTIYTWFGIAGGVIVTIVELILIL